MENLVDVGMGNLVISAPLSELKMAGETRVGKRNLSRHGFVKDYKCQYPCVVGSLVPVSPQGIAMFCRKQTRVDAVISNLRSTRVVASGRERGSLFWGNRLG